MKLLLLLTALLFTSISLNAQSVYLDSLQNTFSGSFSYSKSSDFNSFGYGISYTINSSVSFGLVYITGSENDEYSNEFTGNGFGGYGSFTILNELRENPFGVELGFTFQGTDFEEEGRSDDRFQTRVLGVGLNFSKRSESYEIKKNYEIEKKPSNLVFQAGITAFPISEFEFFNNEISQGVYTDPFVSGNDFNRKYIFYQVCN
tara:strand:+ start:4697 stop:5305 length:609 start_codon:yes stop_codon:yes gene_type:complete